MAVKAYLYLDTPPRFRPIGGGADIFFDPSNQDFIIGQTKPAASNTGASAGLTNYAGSFSPTVNTVYENLRITGSMVDCAATGTYTFRNCEFAPSFSTTAARGVIGGNANANAKIILENCTIKPQVSSNQLTGIYALNFQATRCDISNVTDGFASWGTALVEGNYVHDFNYTAADYQSDKVTHNDGFQIFGAVDIQVRGNFFDMRPGPLSDRAAPSTSSTGGIGQSIALTPTKTVYTSLLVEWNWFDYGFRGIGGAAGANPGGNVTVRYNRYGASIASFPVTGYGSKVRPIIVDPNLNLIGLPTSGLGVPDTANGNSYEVDGTPALVYRQIP